MMMQQLPDGTWVTTPVRVGPPPVRSPCQGGCAWQTEVSEPIPAGEVAPAGMKLMHFQTCPVCGYCRVLLTKEVC